MTIVTQSRFDLVLEHLERENSALSLSLTVTQHGLSE